MRIVNPLSRCGSSDAYEQFTINRKLAATSQSQAQEIAALTAKLKTIEGIVQKARDHSIKPLANAALVVRLRCLNPPEWLDLDLYVQDPNDKLCGYTTPRILERDTETGIIIPSEAIISLDGSTEEIFKCTRAITGILQKPYLVFCMLREKGNLKAPSEFKIEVECRVELQRNGNIETVDSRKLTLDKKGNLYVKDKKYYYPGLTAIHAFELIGIPGAYDFLASQLLPDLPRGWQATKIQGTQAIKVEDQVGIPSPNNLTEPVPF